MRLGVPERVPAELRERGGASDPIGAWLGLFGALAGLPRRERAEVEEELSDHLRERVRDLMVRGLDEHEAVRAAIEELGGAAEMAARFRSVTANSRRRLAMNLSMLGLAGAAAVLSLVAVMQPGAGGGGRVYTPSAPAQVAGPSAKVIDVSFADAELADVAKFLGEAAGVPVIVHWSDLEGLRDTRLTIEAKRVTVAGALALVTEACGGEVDYRMTEANLEIGTHQYFDQREKVLASYDLESADAHGASAEDVMKVIQSLVESEGWRDNGGDLASAYVLGSRLFVEAPPRYHDKIKWILQELAAGGQVGAAGQDGQRPTVEEAGFRRYLLSNATPTEVQDRLQGLIGSPDGLKFVSDFQTNSLIVAGDPGAVEAALVSGLDVAKGAEADGQEPVIVVIEYDGKQEVLAVDRARITTRAELLQNRSMNRTPIMLDMLANVRTEPQIDLQVRTVPWLRDLPLVRPSPKTDPAVETER